MDSKKHETWSANLDQEIAFWRNMIEKRGAEYPDMWKQRMDPKGAFPEWLRQYVKAAPGEDIHALDVGCGPLTMLGKHWEGRTVHVTAIDPLADAYMKLFRDAGVMPPIPPRKCDAEQISKTFSPGTFHVIVSINALDHSYDPVSAIRQIIDALRPGGAFWLRNCVNEGESEQYQGLHQWNFDIQDGRFVIWDKAKKVDVASQLAPNLSITCSTDRVGDERWLTVLFRKPA